MRSSTSIPAVLATSLLFTGILCGPAVAQFRQYTPPGDLQGEAVSRREGLEKDVAEARWHLGSLRIQPELSLRNLAWVDDVFVGGDDEDVSDLTASIAAGLHFYLPLGAKTTLAAYALPEYVWWQDQEDRRRFNDSYGVGLFAYFNRLSLELSGRSDERLSFASSEIEQQITDSTDELLAEVEVFLRRNLSFFISASNSEFRYLVDEAERNDPRIAAFDRLDRDEDLLRGGFRARFRGGWTISLGAERSEATFRSEENDLSNSGTAPYLGLALSRGPWTVNGDAAFRTLEAEGSSSFREFDETTGRIEVSFQVHSRLTLWTSLNRTLTYSVSEGFTYALDERTGLGAELKLGGRTSLTAFADTGEVDYSVGSSIAPRLDDFTGWGATLDLGLGRRAKLQLGVVSTDFDSNLPGFDRSVTRITTNLTLGQTSWP